MALLIFEDGRIQQEGELKDRSINGYGKKRNIIYGLLLIYIYF